MNELETLKQQVADLTKRLDALNSTATIPQEVDGAFRDRLLGNLRALSLSSKDLDDEDISVVNSVNFGAQTVGTIDVLKDPDSFLEISINGTIYYVPAYTS